MMVNVANGGRIRSRIRHLVRLRHVVPQHGTAYHPDSYSFEGKILCHHIRCHRTGLGTDWGRKHCPLCPPPGRHDFRVTTHDSSLEKETTGCTIKNVRL